MTSAEPEYVIVLTTWPARGEGPSTIARALVEDRLAACVNILAEMQSVYTWEGAVAQEQERQLVIKTCRDRLGRLWDRLEELHPYVVPEFVVLPIVDGSAAYLGWVRDSTRPLTSDEAGGGHTG